MALYSDSEISAYFGITYMTKVGFRRIVCAMKTYKHIGAITAFYITFQLISDVTAGKIIQLWIFPVAATVLYFPLTYIISDVLTEVYGYAEARRVLWIVMIATTVAGLIYQLVVWLPPAPGFVGNEAYARVLGSVPRILVGGWIAVFAGDIVNNYVLAKMKIWMKGKYLWARTILSTVFGQGVNTVLFYLIALYAVLPTNLLVASILSGWLIKVAVEISFTPVTYFVVNWLKKAESVDHYDTNTNFTPFKMTTNSASSRTTQE